MFQLVAIWGLNFGVFDFELAEGLIADALDFLMADGLLMVVGDRDVDA